MTPDTATLRAIYASLDEPSRVIRVLCDQPSQREKLSTLFAAIPQLLDALDAAEAELDKVQGECCDTDDRFQQALEDIMCACGEDFPEWSNFFTLDNAVDGICEYIAGLQVKAERASAPPHPPEATKL